MDKIKLELPPAELTRARSIEAQRAASTARIERWQDDIVKLIESKAAQGMLETCYDCIPCPNKGDKDILGAWLERQGYTAKFHAGRLTVRWV